MLPYTLEFYDEAGNVRHSINLTWETDQEAIGMVEGYVGEFRLGLWQGSRCVQMFDAV